MVLPGHLRLFLIKYRNILQSTTTPPVLVGVWRDLLSTALCCVFPRCSGAFENPNSCTACFEMPSVPIYYASQSVPARSDAIWIYWDCCTKFCSWFCAEGQIRSVHTLKNCKLLRKSLWNMATGKQLNQHISL